MMQLFNIPESSSKQIYCKGLAKKRQAPPGFVYKSPTDRNGVIPAWEFMQIFILNEKSGWANVFFSFSSQMSNFLLAWHLSFGYYNLIGTAILLPYGLYILRGYFKWNSVL